jgi:ribonuclease-3
MDILSEKIDFDELNEALCYTCKQPRLLVQAFSHSSYVNEQGRDSIENNERLEFLGDAVLDLAISHILMSLFPKAMEGDLSKFRSMLVDEAGLYEIALKLRLGDYLFLGRGEEKTSGRQKPSILANAVEAIIGAVYLDAGFEVAKGVIHKLFGQQIEKLGAEDIMHDFKSILQEYTQQAFKILPKYILIDEIGPPHDKVFRMALTLKGKTLAEADGKSKKEAEQKVAREAFFCLQDNSDL